MNQFFNGTRVHDSVSFRSGKNSELPVFRGKGSTIVVGRTPHPQEGCFATRSARPKEGFFNSRIFNMCLSFFGGFQKGAQKEKSPWAIWGCSFSSSCFHGMELFFSFCDLRRLVLGCMYALASESRCILLKFRKS